MIFVTLIVTFASALGLGAQGAESGLSREAQKCYDAFVAGFDPMNQLVRHCSETYPKSATDDTQYSGKIGCIHQGQYRLWTSGAVTTETDCVAYTQSNHPKEKKQAMWQRILKYYRDRGLDLTNLYD